MPITTLAKIKEESCIGCTKCIDVCPVDAIMGSEKKMHTVIQQECIGCELCVPACPVDCIELIPLPSTYQPPSKMHIQKRQKARQTRLLKKETLMVPLGLSLSQRKAYLQTVTLRRNKNKTPPIS